VLCSARLPRAKTKQKQNNNTKQAHACIHVVSSERAKQNAEFQRKADTIADEWMDDPGHPWRKESVPSK